MYLHHNCYLEVRVYEILSCVEKQRQVSGVYTRQADVLNIKIVLGNFSRVVNGTSPFLNKRDCPGSDNRRTSGETHQIRINGDKVQTEHINVAIKLISFWGCLLYTSRCV